VLQIIGTVQADTVAVWRPGSGHVQVDASFLPGGFRTFPLLGIDRMIALLCDGDDSITVGGSITLPSRIDGGQGNDTIVGGGGPSVLLGGIGDDSITGGKGRNVIIGGIGADRLVGGAGSDLMIAGSTSYDETDEALFAILLEWNSTRSYGERVSNLIDGLGPVLAGSGLKLKKGVTVFDDADVDGLEAIQKVLLA
jgi:Ca2+-binding RTX toxin-like protein